MMILSVTAINRKGERIRLPLREPYENGIYIENIVGLGPVKAEIDTRKIASSHGSYFNSSRVGERILLLTLGLLEVPDVETTRQRTYKYFPVQQEITLLFETDQKTLRTTGYVEENDPEIFSEKQKTVISVICTDPFFYGLGDDFEKDTIFRGVDPQFTFPFSAESKTIVLGTIFNYQSKNVYYEGDVTTGFEMVLDFSGAASGITVESETTGQLMHISAEKLEPITTIVAGDQIRIDTRKGQKGVKHIRAGVEKNILNALGPNSDWLTLVDGDNVISYNATVGASQIGFRTFHTIMRTGL